MNKLCKLIDDNIMKIFIVFLYMQPIIDVITGVSLYKFSFLVTFSSIIRFAFLLLCIFYIIFIDKKRIKYLLIILGYSVLYTIGMIIYNHTLMYETRFLLYAIYMPITLIFTLSIFKKYKFDNKHLYILLLIYVSLIFIPDLFHIGFNSYSHSKTGSIGFFYSANSVGNIISILFPIFIAYLIKSKKYIPLLLFLAVYIYTILKMGTKAPILFFLFLAIYYFIIFVVKLIKKKKYVILFPSIVLIGIMVYFALKYLPYSSFYTNLVIHLNFLNIHSLSDLLTFKNIDHFLFGSRFQFFFNYLDIYNASPIYGKIFGIGYLVNNQEYKLIEMDYLDTFIHHGIIGFMVIYYLYFRTLFDAFKNYFKSFKKNFMNICKSAKMISIIISILGTLFIGHMLATPSVTIIVVVILSSFICEEVK